MENNPDYTSNETTSDERLLAMLAHLSIFLGGIILPIILWATQKDKSKFVTFNSLQAIFYHIAYGAIIIIYVLFIVFVLILSGIGFSGLSSSHGHNGDMPGIMIVLLILLYGGIFILVFAGIGYAVYVAVKTYQGKLVKIPVIGNIAYKKVYERNT